MNNKSKLLILLCIILALGTAGLTGCGADAGPSGPEDGAGGAGTDTPGAEEPGETEQVYRVSLYFANEEYIYSGDNTLDKFNILSAEIASVPENVYQDTLEKLRNPGEGSSTMVTEQVIFNSVYLEGDTAYVDFKSVGPSSGSMGESFLVSQIVNTLLDFDEVEQVQFLVNGEVVESLMGHVGTAEPFTKDVYSK